jgi:mono/diheme cytochrome c family protein
MRSPILICSFAVALTACKEKDEAAPAPAEPKAETKTEAKEPPPAAPTDAKPDALLERGHYLADLMGCQNCHTPFGPQGPDLDHVWAGGLEVPEAFGTWRSPNITQDEATGIGAWTDEQILAAVREGKRPSGEMLFPIMPYPLYNALSDEDGKALVAYLRTVPAKAHKVERATDLKLPRAPVPRPAGKAPDRADPVAYGGYLASLMHCAMCHTPMTDQGFDTSKAFAGGMKFELPMLGEGALYSSNLTSDPETGIGGWKDEEVLNAVRGMMKRDGTLIVGPMALYQQGWYRLEDADGKALVAFLRSLPPIAYRVPTSTFKPKATPGAPAAPPAAP